MGCQTYTLQHIPLCFGHNYTEETTDVDIASFSLCSGRLESYIYPWKLTGIEPENKVAINSLPLHLNLGHGAPSSDSQSETWNSGS